MCGTRGDRACLGYLLSLTQKGAMDMIEEHLTCSLDEAITYEDFPKQFYKAQEASSLCDW